MSVATSAVIFLIILLIYVVATYNRLVVMRENVKESWSAVETELRRRFDLIPNLVETVKGYAAHEKDTLEAVIEARNSAMTNASAVEQTFNAQNALTGALSRLIALSESYPQLKANENFNQLQNELADMETNISQARRFYNATVREFNASIGSFPNVLLAGPLGFTEKPYFGIDEPDISQPVAIKFERTN